MATSRVTPDALLDDENTRWTVTDEDGDHLVVERDGVEQRVHRLDVASDDGTWRVAPSAGGVR